MLSAPIIFGMSIKDNIDPKLDWLQQRLVLDDEELSKMITKFSAIVKYSLNDNIIPTLDWLQTRLELDDIALGKIIQKLPSILACSIPDNIEPKLNWIQQRLSLTDEGLSKLIQQRPPILGCNIGTNLEPTLNFYITALGDESNALAFVIHNPTSLSYSLEKRLKPRLEEATDAGMIIDFKCLNAMMTMTNDQWNARLMSRRQT